MKKTFFQTTYNLNANLIALALLSFFLKIGINLLIQMIETTKLSGMQGLFTIILDKLTTLEYYIQLLSFCLTFITFLLIIIEIVQRLSKDSLWNYFKSIYQTSLMRQFLKQDEKSESMSTIENQTVTRINPILKKKSFRLIDKDKDMIIRGKFNANGIIKYIVRKQRLSLVSDIKEYFFPLKKLD